MSKHKTPPFLAGGTFCWGALGYQYSQPAPVDLLDEGAIHSRDPWIALAAILEHAKAGHLAAVSALPRLIYVDHPASLLTRATLELLGAAGSTADLQNIKSILLRGEAYLTNEACRAASCAGNLWLVGFMLDAWKRADNLADRETIGDRLSALLDLDWPGPVGSFGADDDEAQYVELVLSRIAELRGQYGSDNVPIIVGRRFAVAGLARFMLALTGSESIQSCDWMFYFLRQRFEASTGTNCSSFFSAGKFQPLAAAAILEEFLASPAAVKYEEGVRYFFGHRIPD